MIRCLALAAAGAFALAACSTQPDSTPAAEASAVPAETNPFYTESSLPYRMPPFDRIEVADFLPAFEKGMADQLAESRQSPPIRSPRRSRTRSCRWNARVGCCCA